MDIRHHGNFLNRFLNRGAIKMNITQETKQFINHDFRILYSIFGDLQSAMAWAYTTRKHLWRGENIIGVQETKDKYQLVAFKNEEKNK